MIAQSSTPTAAQTGRLRSPRGGIVVAGRHYRGGVFLPASARPEVEALAAKATAHAARGPVVIGIAGFSYRVEPVAIAPAVGSVAFSLADLDRNRLHHVHRSAEGEVVCDCPDFEFRRAGTGAPCKHGRRLVELGLIPATTPRVLPPFARRFASEVPTAEAVAGFERWARDRMAGGPGLPSSRPPRPRHFELGPEDMAEAATLMGWR